MAKELVENLRKLLVYWSLIISVVSIVEADPKIHDYDNDNLIEYHYRYAVDESKSQGPVMDRWEQRIGEYVKGAYSVVDPDGRVRTVDYEVDGKKGYHAVIRMNEPGSDLLSYQQLRKSLELYPEAVLPSQPETPSRNLSPPDPSTGKAWNYHSDPTFFKKSGQRTDHKAIETVAVPKTSSPPRTLENLPLGPANFNVPQTTRVIYFETPAPPIVQQNYDSLKPENFFFDKIKTEPVIPVISNTDNRAPLRILRHS